ncbi:RloB family protein [Candidatus Poriferisocius sp.]|uniref:RloB family protein n=1 Tax=Candidatus Poriferisocius sp. TaxID=3101276 RepID=UPI003B025BEC
MKRPTKSPPKRIPGKREQRRVIHILTEGAVTERDYLNIWRQDNRNVHIQFDRDSGKSPLNIVKQAITKQKYSRRSKSAHRDSDFDEIWCVFDVDQHSNLQDALDLAQEHNISVALSNPCFELWLILHYEDQIAHIQNRDAQRRAQALNIIVNKSLKSSKVEDLRGRYEDAKQRAQKLRDIHLERAQIGDHPPVVVLVRL